MRGSSSTRVSSDCVIGSCSARASAWWRAASADEMPSSPSISPRSAQATGWPVPRRISVALVDHGERVPRRGTT
jgi:hypothetical protein